MCKCFLIVQAFYTYIVILVYVLCTCLFCILSCVYLSFVYVSICLLSMCVSVFCLSVLDMEMPEGVWRKSAQQHRLSHAPATLPACDTPEIWMCRIDLEQSTMEGRKVHSNNHDSRNFCHMLVPFTDLQGGRDLQKVG